MLMKNSSFFKDVSKYKNARAGFNACTGVFENRIILDRAQSLADIRAGRRAIRFTFSLR